jgi:hypothetical protein
LAFNVASIAVALLIGGLALAHCVGVRRWQAGTRRRRARLDAASLSPASAAFDARTLDGLPTPCQTSFRHYAARDSLRVPTESEVTRLLPAGEHTCWRGSTSDVRYRFSV